MANETTDVVIRGVPMHVWRKFNEEARETLMPEKRENAGIAALSEFIASVATKGDRTLLLAGIPPEYWDALHANVIEFGFEDVHQFIAMMFKRAKEGSAILVIDGITPDEWKQFGERSAVAIADLKKIGLPEDQQNATGLLRVFIKQVASGVGSIARRDDKDEKEAESLRREMAEMHEAQLADLKKERDTNGTGRSSGARPAAGAGVEPKQAKRRTAARFKP